MMNRESASKAILHMKIVRQPMYAIMTQEEQIAPFARPVFPSPIPKASLTFNPAISKK